MSELLNQGERKDTNLKDKLAAWKQRLTTPVSPFTQELAEDANKRLDRHIRLAEGTEKTIADGWQNTNVPEEEWDEHVAKLKEGLGYDKSEIDRIKGNKPKDE